MDNELILKNLRDAATTMRRDGYISTAADVQQAVFLIEDFLEKKSPQVKDLIDKGYLVNFKQTSIPLPEGKWLTRKLPDDSWLIMKGGYFYRENAQGYTSDIKEAAKFTRNKAAEHCAACSDLTMISYAELAHTENDNYAARLYYSRLSMHTLAHQLAFTSWIDLNDSTKSYYRKLANEDRTWGG